MIFEVAEFIYTLKRTINRDITGTGSALGSVGTQFDFTKMTNGEAVRAAIQLRAEGKITEAEQSAIWDQAATGNAPMAGQQLPENLRYNPTDPTTHNFIALFQQAGADFSAHGDTVNAATERALLNDLANYEGKSLGVAAKDDTSNEVQFDATA
jgi:hypothetical protein